MNTIVFNGCWVGTDIVGVSRYAHNLIIEIDKILIDRKLNRDFEIAVPRSADVSSLKLKKSISLGLEIIKASMEKFCGSRLHSHLI